MTSVGRAVAGSEYRVEAVQWAFLIRNEQPDACCTSAAPTLQILQWVASASKLNGFARSWALRTYICLAAYASPHQCRSHP
jgi:hypothetical protein